MYLEGGHAYVYFTYGMHFCFNVVTRSVRDPEAVLIRAVVPEEGLEEMKINRGAVTPKSLLTLTDGPAKLCQAMQIERSCNGLSLLGDELFIEKAIKPDVIEASPRVGVDYARDAALWPLRFRVARYV